MTNLTILNVILLVVSVPKTLHLLLKTFLKSAALSNKSQHYDNCILIVTDTVADVGQLKLKQINHMRGTLVLKAT